MKYIVYLATLLLFSTAEAQNPTILQGNYISNVFGQSNFVKNPNAQTSVTNVTLTTATATRSTTTPLVATTEWNVTITSANGTAAWATRTFDAGMKNQNCEARFTYRGFQATSKAQIKQGANVVAELVLTPSATDPRIASINFPCGDLSSATTFVITDTATLAGTHEIGGIYVGLATNQANVAQAEAVVAAYRNSNLPITASTYNTIDYNNEIYDKYNEYSAGVFTAKRAGFYQISALLELNSVACSINTNNALAIIKNGNVTNIGSLQTDAYTKTTSTVRRSMITTGTIKLEIGDTLTVAMFPCANISTTSFAGGNNIQINRLPSSSELVVTPETQNVWGGVKYSGNVGAIVLFNGVAPSTTFQTFSSATLTSNRTLKGKCQPALTSNDLGCSIPNMPVGNYKISVHGGFFNYVQSTGANECVTRIYETSTATQISGNLGGRNFTDGGLLYQARTIEGVFTNTSVATRNFVVQASKPYDNTSGSTAYCYAYANTPGNGSDITFLIEPLDNNANSALYVQGPVKAAGTGTAIPAGYVGEVLSTTKTTSTNLASVVFTEITSLTLTPGIWKVRGQAYWYRNGATLSLYNLACTFGLSAADMISSYGPKYSFRIASQINLGNHAAIEEHAINISPFYVRSDGTNLYFADNTTFISGTQTMKLGCYTGTISSGTPVITAATIEAIRIN